jgi:outer membrane protein OmpA-like peptidoglycan-associated protein
MTGVIRRLATALAVVCFMLMAGSGNCCIVLPNVYFLSNSASLTPVSKATLDSLIVFLKTDPQLRLDIFSFTDSLEKDPQPLSHLRCVTVFEYMQRQGIIGHRMGLRWYGSRFPVAPNFIRGEQHTDGLRLNRRTEFRIFLPKE